jgi:1,4-dihydroxy-2-naphthoate octaprenyltransferase
VLIGLVVAHMISNLSNDYFGYRRATMCRDRRACVRSIRSPAACWTPYPDRRNRLLAILGAAICVYFTWNAACSSPLYRWRRGAHVPLRRGAGAAQAIGLGEVAVFLVWGPLMIGGGTPRSPAVSPKCSARRSPTAWG